MKIRKVKWNNSPILGNLEFDFTDPDTGKTCSTIIIAGGKWNRKVYYFRNHKYFFMRWII